jgi:DNA-binding SARP family transcriptional activator
VRLSTDSAGNGPTMGSAISGTRVRLLGSVDVLSDTGAVPVPGTRRAALLAALAVNHRKHVGVERLIDVVWAGEQAPATVTNTVQAHISGLRRLLGAAATIEVLGNTYRLDLGAEGTDLEHARRLLDAAGRQTDPAVRADQLRAALALWRGPALSGVRLPGWLDSQGRQLDALWLRINSDLIELRLASGEDDELVAELVRLTGEHPLDERLHGQLMRALYRAGRQADALAAYQRLRQALDEQLGLDPGPALRELQTAVLRQDPALAGGAGGSQITAPTPPPAQLPMAVARFVGREGALAALDDAAAPHGTAVVCVSGTAGVGKTALAVHWAHRVADRFPDGQLYVNLHGFDPAAPALDPADAVAGFLISLGVPTERIPADLSHRTAMYRSLLAYRRILVLLDNARDAAQVRPLLPGGSGCMVVVTSRDRLTPLVALEGARPLPLDLLNVAEARQLLATRQRTSRFFKQN